METLCYFSVGPKRAVNLPIRLGNQRQIMATLDRGFKNWAERMSLDLRKEMGLNSEDAINPFNLAAFLQVTVWTPQNVPGLSKSDINQLLDRDPWGWSAISIVLPDSHGLVIYNTRKSKGRQASDITHELAHIILDHQPGTIILSSDGAIAMRTFDLKQEEEANWLAWCLLLPREGLFKARRQGLDASGIAARYGVTPTLVNFRINVGGVDRQLRTRRRRH